MNNPFMDMTEIKLRDLCRHYIDSFESWSRRFLDETFRENYGKDYLNYNFQQINQPLFKSETRSRIEQRMKNNPGRFPRAIDAILIDDIEYFLCRNDLYSKHFKNVLEPFYSGIQEIRQVLKRLSLIRNKLSHGNTISIHEAEQCICYANDFIEVYKAYYAAQGKERDYNVPMILRMKDSLGNDFVRSDTSRRWDIICWGAIGTNGIPKPNIKLRAGERYKLWIEVDSSFDSSTYDITWTVRPGCYEPGIIKKGTGPIVDFMVRNKNVSYLPEINIELKTKKDWHRYQNIDDCVTLSLNEVLPPIEETY